RKDIFVSGGSGRGGGGHPESQWEDSGSRCAEGSPSWLRKFHLPILSGMDVAEAVHPFLWGGKPLRPSGRRTAGTPSGSKKPDSFDGGGRGGDRLDGGGRNEGDRVSEGQRRERRVIFR